MKAQNSKPKGFLFYHVLLRQVGRQKLLEIEISWRIQRKYIARPCWLCLVLNRCCKLHIGVATQSNLLSQIFQCKGITFSALLVRFPVQVSICKYDVFSCLNPDVLSVSNEPPLHWADLSSLPFSTPSQVSQ